MIGIHMGYHRCSVLSSCMLIVALFCNLYAAREQKPFLEIKISTFLSFAQNLIFYRKKQSTNSWKENTSQYSVMDNMCK